MELPLISIIVPVYNAEKYLESCLDSLRNQTYKNLQIILVDDGSTDSSVDICDDYSVKDCRIEVYHQENKGQATARNLGLKYAKGEWIGFVDDDDILEPAMYENLLENAVVNNVLISGCATLTVCEDGKCINAFSELKSGIYNGETFVLAILYQTQHAWGAMWNKVWHCSLKDDLFFPDGMQLEDYWVSLRLYHKVGKVYFDDRPMYHWYSRSNSQSNRGFNIQKLSIMEVSKNISNYFEKNGSFIETQGGYYFDFISRVSVLVSMIKTKDKNVIKESKQYINETWKVFKKIKVNENVAYKVYTKQILKLLLVTLITMFY